MRTDGKGNVTEVRTSAGTAVAAYTYAPFGGLLTSSGTYAQPFQFQTKMWHAPIAPVIRSVFAIPLALTGSTTRRIFSLGLEAYYRSGSRK